MNVKADKKRNGAMAALPHATNLVLIMNLMSLLFIQL